QLSAHFQRLRIERYPVGDVCFDVEMRRERTGGKTRFTASWSVVGGRIKLSLMLAMPPLSRGAKHSGGWDTVDTMCGNWDISSGTLGHDRPAATSEHVETI